MNEQNTPASLDFLKEGHLLNVKTFKNWELTLHLFLEYRWMRKYLNRRFHEILKALWLSFLVVLSGFLLIILYAAVTCEGRWDLVISNAIEIVSKSFFEGQGNAKKISNNWMPLLLLPVGIYWSLDAILGRKWVYCAQLFNELVKFRSGSAIPEKKYDATIYRARLNYLEASLACDLVDLDLFFHKSFTGIFIMALKKALQGQTSTDPSIYCHELKNGNKTVKDLADTIGKYQLRCRDHLDHLMEQKPNYLLRLEKHNNKSVKKRRKKAVVAKPKAV